MYRIKLMELGIPASIRGFEYLNYAIQMYRPAQRIMDLYKSVAEYFHTSPSKVERSIRHAISKTGHSAHNGEFIAKYKILWSENQKGE